MTRYTLTEIDRSLYNVLRKGIVVNGLLPDIEVYAANNDGAGYLAKRQEMIDAGVSLVDIYGVGISESREAKTDDKITLDRVSSDIGSIGGQHTTNFEMSGGEYLKIKNNDTTLDFVYEVRVVTNSTDLERDLSSLIFGILGTSRYIPVYTDYAVPTNKVFHLGFLGSVNVSATTDLAERVYRYQVSNIFLDADKFVRGNGGFADPLVKSGIVPLTSVHFKANLYDSPEFLQKIYGDSK